VLEEK